MNSELLKLKKIYRKRLPDKNEEISKVLLHIFKVKYSLSESDLLRRNNTCVNLLTYLNDNQCVNEFPLSDQQLLPLFNESSNTARLIFRVLMQISDEVPAVTYAPRLFPIVSFLTIYLTETEIKNVVVTMLSDVDIIPSSTNDWNVHCHLLAVLGRQFATKAYKLTKACDMRQINFWPYSFWLLPQIFLNRILTCYFIEGSKVLVRAGLLLWKEAYRRRDRSLKTIDWRTALSNTAKTIERTFTPQSFLDRMFRIRNLSHVNIAHCKRGLIGALDSGEWLTPTTSKGYVAFNRKDVNPSGIITSMELIDLIRHLNPFLTQLNKPVQLFSVSTHGSSLRSLYSVASETAATLLILETVLSEVIGAFCADPWSMKNRPDPNRFYGKGECFVFKVRPPPLAVYHWTQDRDNVLANLFQRATVESIEIGGCAIRIGADLSKGRSLFSSTFDSPSLTVLSGEDFFIKSLELLAFEEIR